MALAEIRYSADEIAEKVADLAARVAVDLNGERPVLVAVLKGSLIFMADLSRRLGMPADIDFMIVSEFEGGGSHGVVRIIKDLEISIQDRDVVVVETIVDTGLTLSFLLRTLGTRGPRSLRVCALLDKPVRRIAQPPLDYVGFRTQEYLVGYGLDFKRRYRNLPYLVGVRDVPALAADPDALWGMLETSGDGGVEISPRVSRTSSGTPKNADSQELGPMLR
ncbi:MAG TPA: hypoxanthine phosphoribosyltransferase [Actinomycetota bacterium]|nr:hypoxanthine phosphoribosyltransferase [Actinomycetota bacterium]